MCDSTVQLPPPQIVTMHGRGLSCHTSGSGNNVDSLLNHCESAAVKTDTTPRSGKGIWTPDEHDRFLQAMKAYPNGPWKFIAQHIGTRSVRQVQTHAQKYRQKIARRVRGLMRWKSKASRPEHRIDVETIDICSMPAFPAARMLLPPSPTTPAIDFALPVRQAEDEQPQTIYASDTTASRIATNEDVLIALMSYPPHPAAAPQLILPPKAQGGSGTIDSTGYDESLDYLLSIFQ